MAAIGLGAAAVTVLTLAYGRVPWVALVLAGTFAAYSFLKKAVPVGAVASLATETLVLLPLATAALVVLQARGTGALGHGGRDQGGAENDDSERSRRPVKSLHAAPDLS